MRPPGELGNGVTIFSSYPGPKSMYELSAGDVVLATGTETRCREHPQGTETAPADTKAKKTRAIENLPIFGSGICWFSLEPQC